MVQRVLIASVSGAVLMYGAASADMDRRPSDAPERSIECVSAGQDVCRPTLVLSTD